MITTLEYYLPGLDVSALSEEQFIQKYAYLNVIRKMEALKKLEEIFKTGLGI